MAGVIGCCLCVVGWGSHSLAQPAPSELPSEAVLPVAGGLATRPAAEPVVDQAVDAEAIGDLPPESVLAGAGAPSTAPNAITVAAPVTEQQELRSGQRAVSLPGEEVLPDASASGSPTAAGSSDSAAPAGQAGEIPVQPAGAGDSDVSPGETRPWLRLQYEGHTERVRALDVSADGMWAISGGEDKVLHVWQRHPDRGWLHRRAIRWQVERGPRGRIYRVALHGKLAALAGHGAMGGLGEIWIVDITSGELQRALSDNERGHLQTVAQLAWAPGAEPVLASADVQGRVVIWRPDPRSGVWAGKVLVDHDEATYGAATAAKLTPLRTFVALAFAGPHHLIVPRFMGVSSAAPREPIWRLERLALDGSDKQTLEQSDHRLAVVAMDSSADGGQLASADAAGQVRLWQLPAATGGGPGRDPVTLVREAAEPGQPLDVRLAADGKRLLIGLATAAGGAAELWRLPDESDVTAAPQRSGVVQQSAPVVTCALGGAAGNELWLGAASELHVYAVEPDGQIGANPVQRLATSVRPIHRVAFFDSAPPYELAIDYGAGWEDSFDLTQIQIGRDAQIDLQRLRPSQAEDTKWTVRPESTAAGRRYRLYWGDEPRARLPLQPETHGEPTAIAVVTPAANIAAADTAARGLDQGGQQAVVIGSSSRGNVYVYAAPTERTDEPPRLLRQFRGHTGSVTSLSISADEKYLCSGADDATLAIWPLQGLWDVPQLVNAWGVQLEPTEQGLTVTESREDGPLFFRGVRVGDVLASMRWPDPSVEGGVRELREPAEMRRALASIAFDTLVVFQWERAGAPLPPFQSFPAWQPLAQLLIDRDREWAIWTPAGIYDASINGHRRFGWQVNRGVEQLPDFYRADQFRQRLERPDVIRRLLDRGSLAGALAAVGGAAPPVGEGAIVNQLRARPQIELLSPAADALVDRDRVEIEAHVKVPLGAILSPPKVYANGVVAQTLQHRVDQTAEGERVEYFRWSAPLVSSPQITLEIVAATQAGVWERVTRTIRHQPPADAARRKPRLHLIAVGVGAYRDPQIQSLDFAARGASELFARLQTQTQPLYRFDGVTLLEQDAVRPLWQVYSRAAVDRLASEVNADDLVVLYLCGHGLRDRSTGRWYFVTADARHSDLMNQQYADCLALEDLTALSELPCRKLAILDSCHSGAVQPVMQPGDLKSALRWLQEDRILTLTASEGHEEAAENRELRLGRFTARLLEALAGGGDQAGDRDGVVTLNEAFLFVRQALAADALRDGFVQRPTAGPVDLWHTVDIPLTSAPSPAAPSPAARAR